MASVAAARTDARTKRVELGVTAYLLLTRRSRRSRRMRSSIVAALPTISDDAPPRVAIPPTISSIGRTYLVRPAVCPLCATVTTPCPSGVVDGPGLEDELATGLGDGLGLVLGFGLRRLPFWFRTSVAAFRVLARILAVSGR